MSLKVMRVNGDRYLINTESTVVDKTCAMILESYPHDAEVDFVKPIKSDYRR